MKRLILFAVTLAVILNGNAWAREPVDAGADLSLDLENPVLFLSQLDSAGVTDPDGGTYGSGTFTRQTKSVGWELGGLVAGVTVLGINSWDWGSLSFHGNPEGWFGKNSGSLGMDKLGHAWSTYMISEFLTDRIEANSGGGEGAEITALLLSYGLMTYVELFDGYSADHGFSYEDMVMNALGGGFSYLRRRVPGLREKVDFRLEYWPSGNVDGFHPITDYSGQKYLLALKFSGFEGARDTPLRFLELHAGYYARGFTQAERDRFEPRRREPYVGIGINLGELLFGYPSVRDTGPGKFGRRVLEYVQIPYTYTKRR